MQDFVEIKRHVNKPEERYNCKLVRKESDRVALQYVSDRSFESSDLGISFPPGCMTLAFYFESRPYVFWAIYSPVGQLLGYLIHICKEMQISDNSVDYLDMLLDIWFFPDGRQVVLDEDEVTECLRKGILTEKDSEYIEAARSAAILDFPANANAAASLFEMLDFSGRSQ